MEAITDILPLVMSIIGALFSQSQVVLTEITTVGAVSVGMIGTFLFVVGIVGLFFNDEKR